MDLYFFYDMSHQNLLHYLRRKVYQKRMMVAYLVLCLVQFPKWRYYVYCIL